jgi:hypothetical protein
MMAGGVRKRGELFDGAIENPRINEEAVRGKKFWFRTTIQLELLAGDAGFVQFGPYVKFKIHKLGEALEFPV